MKKLAKELRVQPGEEVDLKQRPTMIKPVYESKGEYKQLLDEHIAASKTSNAPPSELAA